MKKIFCSTIFLSVATSTYAQNYIELRGIVKNKSDSKPLEYAHILSSDKCAGATTNNYGEFLIKIPENHKSDSIRISYMGYQTKTLPVIDCINKSITTFLEPKNKNLNEVVISANSALELLKQAIARIPQNYPTEPYLVQAFNKQIAQEDSCITERFKAVVNIFMQPYSATNAIDTTEIVQIKYSREFESLFILKSNVQSLLNNDLVKYRKYFFDSAQFNLYDYNYEKNIVVEGRKLFVISFDSKHKLRKRTYMGKIYIDSSSLSVVRIEYGNSNKGRKYFDLKRLANEALLFTLTGYKIIFLQFHATITYEQKDEKWYIKDITSYGKSFLRCDRKDRKYFRTIYSTLSITNIEKPNPPRYVDKSKIYKPHISLKYQLGKYDAEFWENYEKTHPQ